MDLAANVKGSKGSGAFGFAFVALLCAGAAGLVAVEMTRSFRREKKLPVVVARVDISAAEPIERDMLTIALWPESQVPVGAFRSVDALLGRPDAEVRDRPVAATGILVREPIVQARLADSRKGTGLATLVRPGYRAVAVKMDNNVVRAGLIYPGAQVDVVGTLRDPASHDMATRILVGDARVLAVEASTDVETYRPRAAAATARDRSSGPNRDAVVTVELLPPEAEMVFLAQREGEVDLALRNGQDSAPVETDGATPRLILAARGPLGDRAAAGDSPAPASPSVTPLANSAPSPKSAAPARAGDRERTPPRALVHRSRAARIASDRPTPVAPEPPPVGTTIEKYDAHR